MGCTVPPEMKAAPSIAPLPVQFTPPPSRPGGVSVEGRELEHSIHGYGAETLLIIGGIHGSEPAGTPLLHELAAYLDIHPDARAGKRVVIAPAVNPDGLEHGTRANARGVDLNRNYPAWNRIEKKAYGLEPLSEPEARYIAGLIEYYKPTRILSMHQPLNCLDWDGPAEELASAMAEACGMKVKKLGARPGSLGAYAGEEMGIPIVTWELPRRASGWDGETLWHHYGDALLAFISAER